MDDKLYKEFENAGWSKMRQQLDVELPQKKNKDKGVIWYLLFGLALLAGYQYFSLQSNLNESKLNEFNKKIITENQQQPSMEMKNSSESKTELEPEISITKQDAQSSNPPSLKPTKRPKSSDENYSQTKAFTESEKTKLKANVNPSAVRKSDNITHNTPAQISALNDRNHTITLETDANSNKRQSSATLEGEYVKRINQSLNQTNSVISADKIPQARIVYDASFIDQYLSLLAYSDIRYSNAYHRMSLTGNNASISPVLILPSIKAKSRSTFFAETSLDYLMPNTVNNPNYFAFSGNIGYRHRVTNKFFLAGQAGIVIPYSNSNLYLDNQGLANASAGNSTTFDASKAAGASADPIIPITGIVLESTRSVTSINNGTLYLSKTDQARINSKRNMQYNFRFSLGYHLGKSFFAETGLDLRDEFKNNPLLISVSSSSNQLTNSNQNRITNYQLPKANYSPQLAIFGLMGYNLNNRWSFFSRIMSPSFKSNQDPFMDQPFLPQNGTINLQTNRQSVATASLALGARFKF